MHTEPASISHFSADGDDLIEGFVRVRGARENNLRNVDVDVPRDAVVAFTGVSGSGKSSLAFGTIYAEAQRRFLESVAPYARRLIQQGHTPKVEHISGLPPAVALQQRRGTPSSRSTVGTLTTLSNSMRMLFSRAGTYPPGSERLESDSFSTNTATGACSVCHGLGVAHTVSEESLVPNVDLTIREGAIAAWPGAWQGKNLRDIVVELGYDVDIAWRELPQKSRDWLLFTEEQPVVEVIPQRDRVAKPYRGRFWSAKSYVLHTLADSKSQPLRERALRHMTSGPCPACGGSGLKPEALSVTFEGYTIADLNSISLTELAAILRPSTDGADTRAPSSDVAVTISADLVQRIEVLLDLGLGYLGLSRSTPTLSPGEMQRLRIATQLRSGLFGVIYVLDEPSAGLHPADAEPLLVVLEKLKSSGNSVFVVEHNMDIVRRADWLVDVGPRAGEGGGSILYSGPVPGLGDVPASITRPFLFDDAGRPAVGRTLRIPDDWLRLEGIRCHNLQDLVAEIPLGVLTAVSGVSGSGKSTLVSRVLADVVGRHLRTPDDDDDGGAEDLESSDADSVSIHRAAGLELVDRLVRVDQKPIGRTPRSNLATYTGLFDSVRKVFAATDTAGARGFGAGRFSFNVASGRCETCQGEGFIAVELLFLPGSYGPCPVCHGSRYNAETLEVTYRDRNIAEVLGLTVDAAAVFLSDIPAAARSLETLKDVGLGYLRLGQPATELSGGEAQRIKLATELQRARRGHTLYLLDEPTTGLHPADVQLLLKQLNRLVDAGNTVVVVEHDMDVVAAADWVIDLGPSGGDEGGRIVAAGTPSQVAADPTSKTAPYLRLHR
ncbi:excinuclease ABC subunit UvrA [Arthrobacter sp. H5]|uniref:excinuclease ABC subunit UvrA n=1 Tax=Arthrobacter sp. H5 TaxID=1267973 RepID=UPI0004B8E7BA|nr:excinuclease ABC subunit UvrA [Arthrobacter sp. H5]